MTPCTGTNYVFNLLLCKLSESISFPSPVSEYSLHKSVLCSHKHPLPVQSNTTYMLSQKKNHIKCKRFYVIKRYRLDLTQRSKYRLNIRKFCSELLRMLLVRAIQHTSLLNLAPNPCRPEVRNTVGMLWTDYQLKIFENCLQMLAIGGTKQITTLCIFPAGNECQ